MFITLTELRYVLAVAQEKHFGRASEKCFVSQPTLSIAIKKLEDNLGLQIFERNKNHVIATVAGLEIISKAQQVVESVAKIEDFAKSNNDQFATPLKVGAIHTVGPYLFPNLISQITEQNSRLRLLIEEDITTNLSEKLAHGELDAIIVAKPFIRPNTICVDLYKEPLDVIIPANHAWKSKKKLNPDELNDQTFLLLGNGHCFRDQVLQICPQCNFSQADSTKHALITSSIETIKYMVASNIGISVVPRRALRGINPKQILEKQFIAPIPYREIILVYRSSFSRLEALNELIKLLKMS